MRCGYLVGVSCLAGVALAAGLARGEVAYGVTAQQRLVTFDTDTPGSLSAGVSISGLAPNDTIAGIDIRPNDGFLYALGTLNNLYRINPATGQATATSTLSTPLNGASFGFDFNPTGPVALRIVSNTRKNYRLTNPGSVGSGPIAVATDTDLAYVDATPGTPTITHVAYTNSFAGASSTVLYGIDVAKDTLVRFDSPNAGTVRTVGALGMGSNANINTIGGFDISGSTGMAFAATQNISMSSSTLWGINLATGAGVNLGEIGGGETLVAFTIVPAPSGVAALGLGLLAIGRRRR